MSFAVSCPRCGRVPQPPGLTHADWRCARCGQVEPLHTMSHISPEIVGVVRDKVRVGRLLDGLQLPPDAAPVDPIGAMALWCPWPLLAGWTVTGVAWVGDDRTGARATATALSGPDPLAAGPADVVFVTEEMGVGLGNALAGLPGPDPGPALADAVRSSAANAKVKVGGHLTPLWAVTSQPDRSVYVGEARGRWLYAITWPALAGYVLAEDIALLDLVDAIPTELVFGAPSRHLRIEVSDG